MTPAQHGEEPSRLQPGSLETGDQLHRWRVEQGLTAKRVGQLIELTERSIHRAERGGRLGPRIKLGMKLLAARIAAGEIVLSPENKVVERLRRRPDRGLVVREAGPKYGKEWHGQLCSGADIRAWRKSMGLYVKEVAELLGVVVPSLIRAEQSDSPSSRIVYGVELLRAKVLSGEIDISTMKRGRVKRGPRKKS
jgi:transcriptional regulator with XRE-family HTH domain